MPAKKTAASKGSTTKKSATKKGAARGSGKRELISPKGDNRYVRRDAKGRITESDDQGRSLSKDVRQHSATEVKPGYGDRGDQPRRKSATKKSAKKSSAKKS
ncbi:MAG: hypothetical protein WCD76_12465 [Pyrinomonadaceae bacterium]